MTFENLTADADALRRRLGYQRWAVLGHSFGGHVALEYALRYPGSLSHLVLIDTGGDSRWARHNAAGLLASRGYSPEKVELVRRLFNGEFRPRQMPLILMRIGSAYYSRPSLSLVTRELIRGEWRSKMRPDAMIFAGRHLVNGWTVMDRLSQITVPTLIVAGRDDFIFPPEHQRELAAAIPRAPADHRARGPQPARRAARRGHACRQGLHLRIGATNGKDSHRRLEERAGLPDRLLNGDCEDRHCPAPERRRAMIGLWTLRRTGVSWSPTATARVQDI
jgi:proline iminopeptidase